MTADNYDEENITAARAAADALDVALIALTRANASVDLLDAKLHEGPITLAPPRNWYEQVWMLAEACQRYHQKLHAAIHGAYDLLLEHQPSAPAAGNPTSRVTHY